jgi:hypothetical protein
MSNDDTEEEGLFRERYPQELQKKKQQPGETPPTPNATITSPEAGGWWCREN